MGDQLTAPPHLSPSSIGTFEQCPLKFKYSRIDGMKEPPTEATLRGNFVHDALEELYKFAPEHRTLDVAREVMRDVWDNKWRDQVEEIVPPEDIRNFRWTSWWCVENLWKVEDPETVVPAGLETLINCDVDGVTIKGFIDRWEEAEDGSLVVVDYKTGKTPKPQYRSDKYFQLMVYAVGMRELGFGDASHIKLLFLKDGTVIGKDVEEQDFENTTVRIRSTKDQIDQMCETGKFPHNKTVLCGWCHFKPICPAWKK